MVEWFCFTAAQEPAYWTRAQEKKHNKQLYDWLGEKDTELLRKTVLGLVRVYNKLPQEAVDTRSVKDFQRWLQEKVKREAVRGTEDWENCLNLRKRSWRQRREKP